jgi:hypothetical protein
VLLGFFLPESGVIYLTDVYHEKMVFAAFRAQIQNCISGFVK